MEDDEEFARALRECAARRRKEREAEAGRPAVAGGHHGDPQGRPPMTLDGATDLMCAEFDVIREVVMRHDSHLRDAQQAQAEILKELRGLRAAVEGLARARAAEPPQEQPADNHRSSAPLRGTWLGTPPTPKS